MLISFPYYIVDNSKSPERASSNPVYFGTVIEEKGLEKQ